MANYTFSDVAGATLAFDPRTDRLLFEADQEAASLAIVQAGNDVRVLYEGAVVRLAGLSTSQLDGTQFSFASGAVARFGSVVADMFTGAGGDDAFDLTAGGSDTVSAGAGNDRIVVGSALDAADAIDGGAGAQDTLLLSGSYARTVTFGATTVRGVEVFRIEGDVVSAVVRLALHEAALSTASAGVNFLADTLSGRLHLDGHAVTTGFAARSGAGDDTLLGGAGADTLEGGEGDDSLTGGAGADRFTIAMPSLSGNRENRTLDTVSDFALGDRLDLVHGPHRVHFALDAQPLAFRAGSGAVQDFVRAGDGLADIHWQWNEGALRLEVWVDASDDGRIDEADLLLHLHTGAGGRTTLAATDFANLLARRGTAGADRMTGSANDDVIVGDAGNDTLSGGAGADALFGGADRDTLDGGAGSDSLVGGAGSDTYRVRDAQDHVQEAYEGGTDTVLSYLATYVLAEEVERGTIMLAGGAQLEGNAGDNRLKGGNGNDALSGEGGDDTLDGGAGADTLTGGYGADVYVVRSATVVVVEPDASDGLPDRVESHVVDFTLGANIEQGAIQLDGGARLAGNRTANGLSGRGGQDTLVGGEGADTLDGGAGIDSLVGGIGHDIYLVDHAGDSVVEATSAGTDTVVATVSFALGAGIENLELAGSAALSGTGNALENRLQGNGAANVLDGGAGADTLSGGAGDDTYVVDSARDDVWEDYGQGVDTLVASVSRTLGYGIEHLILTGTARAGNGNELANVLRGNAQDNVLDGAEGRDTLTGGLGNDTYHVDARGDRVEEARGGGTDTVVSTINHALAPNLENLILSEAARVGKGNALANVLRGSSGMDTLDGGGGADTLHGGAGSDLYKVDHRDDVVIEKSRYDVDIVVSTVDYVLGDRVERLTLAGEAAIDGTGNALGNRLTGNKAANRLDGGKGSDVLEGGRGDDTYLIDAAGDHVIESRRGGTDTVVTSVDMAVLPMWVENLVLAGSARNGEGNDLANVLRGNDAANVLDGRRGADTMVGGRGNDTYHVDHTGDVLRESKDASGGIDTVVSSARSYTLGDAFEKLLLEGEGTRGKGNAAANEIHGSDGNDTLDGGGGADTLVGGDGADTYIVQRDDVIVEDGIGWGDTAVVAFSWTLPETLENLRLTGSANLTGTGNDEDNHLVGNDGRNVLNGGKGSDVLEGGEGNDTYIIEDGESGTSVVERARSGVDHVIVTGSHFLESNVENLTVVGDQGNENWGVGNGSANRLAGGGGVVRLIGRDGDDTLVSGGNDDFLVGGAGADRLTGGRGADLFIYEFMTDSRLAAHDVITDFERGVDRIDLSELWLAGPGDAAPFLGTDPFGPDATDQLRYRYDAASKSVMLYGSTDEDAKAEFMVQLRGISSLSAADFVF